MNTNLIIKILVSGSKTHSGMNTDVDRLKTAQNETLKGKRVTISNTKKLTSVSFKLRQSRVN